MKKKSILKKWWFWVLAIFFLIGISNLANDPQESEAAAPKDAVLAEEKAPEVKPDPNREYSIGEVAVNKGAAIKVVKKEVSAGIDFDKPKDGHEYIIVHVEIENVGKDVLPFNPFYFKMLNSKGQLSDTDFTIIDKDTALTSGDLVTGGKVSGTLVFEQPIGESKLQLQYELISLFPEVTKINLQ